MGLNFPERTYAKLSEDGNKAYLFKYKDIFERTFTDVKFPSFSLNDPNFHNSVCTFQSIDLNLYKTCQKKNKLELAKASEDLKEKLKCKIEELKSIESSDAKQNLLIFEGFDENWFDVRNLIISNDNVYLICWGIIPKYIDHIRNKEVLISKPTITNTNIKSSPSIWNGANITLLVISILALIVILGIMTFREIGSYSNTKNTNFNYENSMDSDNYAYSYQPQSFTSNLEIWLSYRCSGDSYYYAQKMRGMSVALLDNNYNKICDLSPVQNRYDLELHCNSGYSNGDCYIGEKGTYIIKAYDKNKFYETFYKIINLNSSNKKYIVRANINKKIK